MLINNTLGKNNVVANVGKVSNDKPNSKLKEIISNMPRIANKQLKTSCLYSLCLILCYNIRNYLFARFDINKINL